jgi:nucleoside-diphosphate-sugar epimerase
VGAVNVASGRPVEIRSVAEAIGRTTGRADLLRPGALPDRAEPPFIVADTTRLVREVGFTERADLEGDLAALA